MRRVRDHDQRSRPTRSAVVNNTFTARSEGTWPHGRRNQKGSAGPSSQSHTLLRRTGIFNRQRMNKRTIFAVVPKCEAKASVDLVETLLLAGAI